MGTFLLPGRFGKKPTVTLQYLVARSRELEMEIRDAQNHVAHLEDELVKLNARADEAGLARQLRKALAPPPPAPVVEYTRCRVIKPFKILWRGPHGTEWYSSGPNAVNDFPSELVTKLRGRLEPVPPTTEHVGVPLEDWMRTDD